MLGRHLGQFAGRTLRRWPVLALSLAALLGAALAANTASPLQAQTTTPMLGHMFLEGGLFDTKIPLRPNFAPHITEYTVSVPNQIDDIDLRASASEGSVSIANDDDTSTPYEANLDLSVGYNTVTVTVTSADGNATNVYTVTVTRASPPPAPTDCPADADWCATMVVGHSSTTAGSIRVESSGYGHNERTSDLSSDRFVHDGTVYQVSDILRSKEISSGSLQSDELLLNTLFVSLPHGTVFQVGDREFTIDSYSDNGDQSEVWDISGNPVDLTEGEYVTVSLKFPSVLVSNASHFTDASVGGVIVAQSFATGSHEQGYTVTEVQIALEGDPSLQSRVRIREDDGGEPATGTQLANFSNPATLTTESLNTFTAPEGLRLDPDTTYWITMGEEVAVNERVPTGRTTNTGETGKTGWSMGDEALERTNGSLPWSVSNQIPVMSVNGFPRTNSPATGAPVIEGTPVAGQRLTAHTRTIRDDDGRSKAAAGDADYAYTYQWERVDADGASNPEEIAGATGKTYTVTNADIGRALRVKVSFTDDADFEEGPLTSDALPPGGTVACDGIWCATLYPKSLTGGSLGCNNNTTGKACSEDAVLTEDGFTFNSTGHSVTSVNTGSGGHLNLWLDSKPTESDDLTLHVGDDAFAFSDADEEGDTNWKWNNPGLTWSEDDPVELRISADGWNTAPTFVGTSNDALFETLGDAVVQTASNIGLVLSATDADGDTLSYWLEFPESDKFDVDSTTGLIRTRTGESYNREAKSSYIFAIRVADGRGGINASAVSITIIDQDEPPLAPNAPRVSANADSETSLDVSWTAPNNQGRPRIRSYDLQYREGNTGDFTDGPQNVTGASAVIEDLEPDTTYEVRVRATNEEGDGEWSPNGAATTAEGITLGDGIFENVRIVETTIDYVELDWDMPPRKIAGTRITRHRQGDPDDHRYGIYGEFGTRNTGFRDVWNIEPGQTYTYRVIPWVVNDIDSPVYSRETSKLGDSVPITTTLPDAPPFVAQAPTGITYNVYGHSTRLHVEWNEHLSIDEWRRIPAYIFQWRKASEEYETGLESEPRTVINAPTTYKRLQYEGFIATITQPPSWRLSIPGLPLNTSHYFRVGTCQELLATAGDVESCDLADVRFASERSFILSRNLQGASVRALAPPAEDAGSAPEIRGSARVGETLTADTAAISDDDGMENAVFAYQWLAGETGIKSATGSSYTLTENERGKAVRVRVSFTDDAGNPEARTSLATAGVEPRSDVPATGAPVIMGTAQVGETLTADTSGISDDDGLNQVSYSYQWLADDAAIADATGSTYTLTDADEGAIVTVRVSFTDDAGHEESLTSKPTEPVSIAVQQQSANSPATNPPIISGTAQVGQTLTADASGIADEDGLTQASFTYQWSRQDLTSQVVTDMTGATGSSYVLTADDRDSAISVSVSFTDDAGNDEKLTSYWVPVFSSPNSPATGAPTIGGTAQVGETLTASTSGVADQDGLSSVAYQHQWLADGVDIAGATGPTYTLVDADEGAAIKVRVSFTDDAGHEESLTSAATDAVVEAEPAEPPAAPTGLTAAASHDRVALSWDDPQDDSITGYVILRRNRATTAPGEFTELVADTGSAANTYTDDSVASETLYTYRIRAMNEHGVSELSRWARADTPAPPPANSPATGAPTISGTVQVDETLTADISGIADQDGLSSAVYRYQWLADDADIGGSTGSSYTLQATDKGVAVKVRVSFTDDAGNDESLTSAATDTVEARPNSPATGAPVIVGTAQVGQTLTADTSGIADADGLTNPVYRYQWIVSDGGADLVVPGAKASTYTVLAIDRALVIKVRVRVTDDRGHVETRTSAPTAVVR